MVGPDTHEDNCDNGGTTDVSTSISHTVSIYMPGQTSYTNHVRMPSEHSGGTGNFWYSFDHGTAHSIQLDTETDPAMALLHLMSPVDPKRKRRSV
jgi:acid phosphatase type 7